LIAKIIISLAGLFSIFQLFRGINNFAKSITIAFITSIALSWLPYSIFKTIGFFLFGLALLTSIVYAAKENKSLSKRALMLLIIIPVFIRLPFMIMNWPFAFQLSLAMLIPILAYLVLIIKTYNVKHEIGFLTIIVTDAVFGFSRILLYWFL
jgi:hypothetical protein